MNKMMVAVLALALTGGVAFAQGQGNGGGQGGRGGRGGNRGGGAAAGQVQPGGADGGAGMQGGFGGGFGGGQGGFGAAGGGQGGRGGRGGRGGQGGMGGQGGFGQGGMGGMGGQGGFGQGGMGGQGGRGGRGGQGGFGQGGMGGQGGFGQGGFGMPGGDFGGGMMGPGGMGGARSGQLQRTIDRLKADTPREQALKQLEAKDKDAYAKAKKAIDDANAQLAELAKKAEVVLPETEEQQKAKALEFLAKEKDAIDKLLETDKTDSATAMRSFSELAQKNNVTLAPAGRGGMGGGMGAQQPGARGTRANNGTLRQIQEKFPAEYEEAQKLRQTDPAAYREKIQELQQKLNAAN